MNKTKRIQPRVLIENVDKLDEMAEKAGLDRQEFIKKVAYDRFVFPDEDFALILKVAKIDCPFNQKEIKTITKTEITNWNTARYSVEVTDETEMALWTKAHQKSCTGRYAVADLLNKMCVNGITFIQEGTIELIKGVKGAKK